MASEKNSAEYPTKEGSTVEIVEKVEVEMSQKGESYKVLPEKRTLSEFVTEGENVEANDDGTFKTPQKNDSDTKDIDNQIREAKMCIKEKEDILRKLKLVRTYRTKWETQDLAAVTAQWLRVSQESLEDLLTKVKDTMSQEVGQELTLASLIRSLGIDPSLLKLDEGEDCFAVS